MCSNPYTLPTLENLIALPCPPKSVERLFIFFFFVGFPTNFEHACVNDSNYDNQQHLVKSINNNARRDWEGVHK
jgi:hypothetical protein